MSAPSTFTIYNASAGSGKTFTLVKEYLKILLQTTDVFKFQEILAITFTNKAAYEMKERVLKNLELFGKKETNDLFCLIQKELELDSEILQNRSQRVLEAILQNYSAFSITTIDSFTHKIIKSFAYDLGLSQNFEVEMDADDLLKESIDVLISKIGVDKEITRTLVQYAKDKSENDQSWDITLDLFEFSRLLLNEDDVRNLKKIENKNLSDYESLNKKLRLQNKEIEKELKELGEKGLIKIEELGLEYNDFSSSYFPKLLNKMIGFETFVKKELSFNNTLVQIFNGEKAAYPKRVSDFNKNIIDSHFSFFEEIFTKSKKLYDTYRFNRLVLKSIIPLATLQYIHKELSNIKEENNIQLNSEFNHLISQNIQNQPAPYIYERVGNKFRHYFIDEMQDTSQMQWQNLIPLLLNTLSQEDASLMLVGDGKQSIYRWRGGKAEQFIDLGEESQHKNPFSVPKNVEKLEQNFRSYSEIIDFNNDFFSFVSAYASNSSYKDLFLNTSYQKKDTSKNGGYVTINFLDKDHEQEDVEFRYAKKVHETIIKLNSEFNLNEICVIVRKRKDGVLIADYLTENNIPIISSETLLLKNNFKVNFLINLLEYSINETDDIKFKLLDFLYDFLKINTSKHDFFTISFNSKTIWDNSSIDFDENYFSELPLYEKMEYAIEVFKLLDKSDAYVQFFLDQIIKFQQKEFSIQEVLEFWELKKDKLSIVSPEGANAVQIMTIHKSKGLEFPVVIYSGDVNVYEQINPKIWYQKSFKEFDDFLIPYAKELSTLNESTQKIYQQRRNELELDSLNLLYVTLTRAKEMLFVITDNSKAENTEATFFSQYFKQYLIEKGKYHKDNDFYEFGNQKRVSQKSKDDKHNHKHQEEYISVARKDHKIELLPSSSKLWETKKGEAIDYGNLFHTILSKIKTAKDIEHVLRKEYENGNLLKSVFKELKLQIEEIVNHPKLRSYYYGEVKILNERVLTGIDGQLLIPDRLIFHKKEVVILDYKTGVQSESHKQQLLKYERLMKNMGYLKIRKILVYLSKPILIEEF